MKNKKNLKRLLTILIVIVLLAVIYVRVHVFLSNFYKATNNAWEYIDNPSEGVSVEYIENTIVFAPEEEPVAGLIFYPGGLVESEAYAPLLEQLAENGIECILVEMPYYLAILDANGARGIQAKYPEIDTWYIGGHSLGGAMASLYADRHSDEYEGLILLAAYSTKDLNDDDIDILLVNGSNDLVMNRTKYEKNKSNLPADYDEVVIEGGCHSYFGDYGLQSGDGNPTITCEEQTDITKETIIEFINE